MTSEYIFGHGSLINRASLAKTCPNAKILAHAVIFGFKRNLDLRLHQSPRWFEGIQPNATNLELGHEDDWINGVWIEVPRQDFQALLQREVHYSTYLVEVFDYESRSFLGQGTVFWAKDQPKSPAPWHHPYFCEYIQTCLEGCRNIGGQFLEDFLETTYISDQPLKTFKI